jgi:hypothetical protein
MNSKRRAELQRKLSMGAVPRPPAGLAERIKADIPNYLKPQAEQSRISTSLAFSMRLAASIILLITSVLVTLHVLEPGEEMKSASAPRVQLDKAVLRIPQASTTTTAATNTAPAEEIRVEISEEIPLPPRLAAAQRARPLEVPAVESREEESADAAQQTATLGFVAERREQPVVVAEAAPPPPPPPAAAPAPVADTIAATASAPSLMREAFADELDLDAKTSVFGISLDPETFHRIRESLESGARPERSAVNVEALVNYFAGAPSRPPRRGVRLEVEASPAPIQAEGDHAMLRFTIDTPAIAVPEGGSTPPAVKDARIEVEIDRKSVASYRRIGEGDSIASEAVLLHNMSVTGLYELELKPRLRASQRVATVRLRYRSITDNRERTIERVIHGRDLVRNWTRASRRHRLASLGAVWGESLKNSAPRTEVARRAEELATQNPRDQRARELANAASATGGGER